VGSCEPYPAGSVGGALKDESGESVKSRVIPATAAIRGSRVDAAGPIIVTQISARHQNRHNFFGKVEYPAGDTFYEFTGGSAHLLVDAMQRNDADLQTLSPIHALLSRIRLSSSEAVSQTPEQVLETLSSTYSEPNITAKQLKSGQ